MISVKLNLYVNALFSLTQRTQRFHVLDVDTLGRLECSDAKICSFYSQRFAVLRPWWKPSFAPEQSNPHSTSTQENKNLCVLCVKKISVIYPKRNSFPA